MYSDFVKNSLGITSQATYVDYGYGQVEPNHLSAETTAQVYAQLPAASTINVLENGQFVKYDYANGVVNFTGDGEWMLVYNEIKLYRDDQGDCEFAMVKDNYAAKLYSPFGTDGAAKQPVDWSGIVAPADKREADYSTNPMGVKAPYKPAAMPTGTTMVPRVLKTNVGDIFTTNTIKATTVTKGDKYAPNASGILEKTTATTGMLWQAAKIYTMPDGQKGVKFVRIQ